MADKKISVVLSAKDQFSQVFEKSDKTLTRLRATAGSASEALNKLKQSQSDVRAYRETYKALDETNKKLAENRTRVEASSAALRAAQAEQRRYQSGIKAAEETLRALDMELAKNGRLTKEQKVAYLQAKQSLETLQPALKKASAEVTRKRKEDNAANREMKSLTATAERQTTRVRGLSESLGKAGVNAGKLSREEARLATDTERATRALQKQEARIKTLSGAQAKMAANKDVRSNLRGEVMGTAIAAAPAVALGKMAMDYESAWSDVQKVVDFKDKAEEASFQRRIRNQAKNLGVSQTGMTEIVASAGQAGVALDKNNKVDVNALEKFSVDAAKMAVAFDTDAGTAGETMAKMRSSMKLNQDQMLDLANFINEASNTMAVKPMEAAAIMKRMGANVKLSGFSNNQAAALAAALVSSGDTEETGATAMKNISGRLTKGFSATKAQKSALSMLGFNPEVLAKDMQRDAPKTLVRVLEAVNTQSPDQKTAIISQIFGEEVAGSVAKLAGNVGQLQKAFDLAGDSAAYAGSMEKEYQKKAATRAYKMKRLQSSLENTGIALGTMLLPIVDSLAPPIAALADGLTNLLETSETAKTAFDWTVKIGAGLLALKLGMMAFKGVKSLVSDVAQLGKIGRVKLGGVTDKTAASANRAADALARMNRQLGLVGRRGSGAGGGGGFGSDGARPGRRGRFGRRIPRLPGGKLGAVAAVGGMMLSSDVMGGEMFGGEAGGALPKAEGAVNMLQTGAMMAAPLLKGGAGKLLGKAFMPLQLLGGALGVADAAKNGNAADVGRATGDAAGGMGGMALGAAIGTAILPGVGTVIGGALGGMAGSGIGSAIGEKVGPWVGKAFEGVKGWFGDDKPKTATATEVAQVKPKDLVKTRQQNLTPLIEDAVKAQAALQQKDTPPPAPQVNIQHTSHFNVKPSGDPAQDNALVQKIEAAIRRLNAEMLASGMGAINGVDARKGAALAGQRSD